MDSSYYFNYNSSDDEDLIDHHQSNLPPLGQRNIHNDGANIRVQENNIPILGPQEEEIIFENLFFLNEILRNDDENQDFVQNQPQQNDIINNNNNPLMQIENDNNILLINNDYEDNNANNNDAANIVNNVIDEENNVMNNIIVDHNDNNHNNNEDDDINNNNRNNIVLFVPPIIVPPPPPPPPAHILVPFIIPETNNIDNYGFVLTSKGKRALNDDGILFYKKSETKRSRLLNNEDNSDIDENNNNLRRDQYKIIKIKIQNVVRVQLNGKRYETAQKFWTKKFYFLTLEITVPILLNSARMLTNMTY